MNPQVSQDESTAAPSKEEAIVPLALPEKYRPRLVLKPFIHMLPGELRNKIYEMIGFRRSKRIALSQSQENDFAQVSRMYPRLRNEINSFVFADCMFEVDVISRFVVFPGARAGEFRSNTISDRWMEAGKLMLPQNHWTRQADIDVRFLKISFDVKETRNSLIARVHFVARPDHRVGRGRPRASMIVREIVSVNVKKSVEIMTKQARKLVTQYSRETDFAGFTMSQLDNLARCFEWKIEDMATENARLRHQTEKLVNATKIKSEFSLRQS